MDKRLISFPKCADQLGAYPAFYLMRTGGFFPEGKAAPHSHLPPKLRMLNYIYLHYLMLLKVCTGETVT